MAKKKKRVVGAKAGKVGTAAKMVAANTQQRLTRQERADVMEALQNFQRKAGKNLTKKDLDAVKRSMTETVVRRRGRK